jgi:chloramphenicol 3-O phosphotransferase
MAGDGSVVILNGASSAGKTTIAASFRDRRAVDGELWVLIGIDDYLSKLPVEWLDLGLPGGPGARASDGLGLRPAADGLVLHVGPVCRRLLRAYYGAVAVAARAGLNVLVDEVVVDETAWHDWQAVLAGLSVVWVGIRCSREVAEAREQRRGDRPPGMTRAQVWTVHEHARYDAEIDTTELTPGQAGDKFAWHMRRLGR